MHESDGNTDSDTADVGHLEAVKQPVEYITAEKVLYAAPSQASNGAYDCDRTQAVQQQFERPYASVSSPTMSIELRDRIIHWLRKHVPISRLQHILRVEQFSIELAQLHHIDLEQAAQAALMHDLAKFFKPQRLLQMAQAEGIILDPVDVANPHLLHATVGAIVARDEFGIQNEAVLDAIRNHTLGSPGMSALSCIVFLADSLEPGRGETPELVELRQSSQQDLYRAVWLTCDESLRHFLSRAQQIHPRMVSTRNWALDLTYKKSPAARIH